MSKALWYIAKHGCKPAPKIRKRIRTKSVRKAREDRRYNAAVRVWKLGRLCICTGIKDASQKLICSDRLHACQDNHHSRGKLGPLLHDQRFWQPVCRAAHIFLHNNPTEAARLGLLEKGKWNNAK